MSSSLWFVGQPRVASFRTENELLDNIASLNNALKLLHHKIADVHWSKWAKGHEQLPDACQTRGPATYSLYGSGFPFDSWSYSHNEDALGSTRTPGTRVRVCQSGRRCAVPGKKLRTTGSGLRHSLTELTNIYRVQCLAPISW